MIQHDYHDATLVEARLDWASGSSEVQMRLCAREATVATLRFEGVTEFSWSRRLPWGESVSINEVRSPEDGSIEIEMQSGDVIRILAKRCKEVTRPDRDG